MSALEKATTGDVAETKDVALDAEVDRDERDAERDVAVTRDAADEANESDGRFVPRDAAVVRAILRDVGVRDCDARVIAQGMEFVHRCAAEALVEAAAAREHAGRVGANDALTVDDIKVGVRSVLLRRYLDPPSLADARAMASRVNAKPLPKLTHRPGIHVPTEMNLLSDNWDIGPPRERDAALAAELEREAEAKAAAAAAALAAREAVAKATSEPTNIAEGEREGVAFDVRAKPDGANEEEREDLGDFAEFMDVDDDE